MNYIAIDFEVANMRNRASVCAVGIVEVQDGKITLEKYTLVNPQVAFDPFCVAVHGITPEMVEGAPIFPEVWNELSSLLKGRTLVAHNASFDMSVLRSCLEAQGLDYPDCTYVCSYLLSRKIWPGLPSYKLNHMAAFHGLGAFRHHDALEDARTAAHLLLKCLEAKASEDCRALAESCGYRLGALLPGGACETFSSLKAVNKGSRRLSAKTAITPTVSEFNKAHAFYKKNIVFTGRMDSLTRHEAMQRVVNCGGRCADSVELQTHFLVIGQSDYVKLLNGTKRSSKIQKAEKLAKAGLPIRLLSEQEFMSMLG
ncbi:exonuclease domain-containing protein [Paenibacillus caui]|uniref:exonuclease domain-containing protein n=1 Tax=Paenibacillus caui TaxID=2873927 RepID=UPI001CA8D07C|nr:exonuclease domain-containing protein [Paenibacillus caui]